MVTQLLHCQPLVFSFFRQQLLHFTPAGCSFTAALTAALIYTLQSVQLEQLINNRRVHFIAYCRLDPVECKHYLCPVNCISIYLTIYISDLVSIYFPPQSTEGPYLDHGETTNEPIEKVYVTTLVTTMGLFKYVDGGNSKITPKK